MYTRTKQLPTSPSEHAAISSTSASESEEAAAELLGECAGNKVKSATTSSAAKLPVGSEFRAYLDQHPEIKHILKGFIVAAFRSEPSDVYEFAADYFKNLVPAAPSLDEKRQHSSSEASSTSSEEEDNKSVDQIKWETLEHHGPIFSPPYEPLPDDVHFYYDGDPMKLSVAAEEVATLYAKALRYEFSQKELFKYNFFKDWRRYMTADERTTIVSLEKCDFRGIDAYFWKRAEERRNLSKEEKLKLKGQSEALKKKYSIALVDGCSCGIINYMVEPCGLFRGRGNHPKMGSVKRHIQPEDVVINCSTGNIPEPPPGHRWKEVRHDNSVTWLARWTCTVLGTNRYMLLCPRTRIQDSRESAKRKPENSSSRATCERRFSALDAGTVSDKNNSIQQQEEARSITAEISKLTLN